jgi:hypothetical protein
VDKKVARAFLPGTTLEKHGVVQCIEVVLTPQDDFCPSASGMTGLRFFTVWTEGAGDLLGLKPKLR